MTPIRRPLLIAASALGTIAAIVTWLLAGPAMAARILAATVLLLAVALLA